MPEKTDVYLVVLSQRLKHETLCSSFTILQPATVKKELSEQQGTVPSDNRYNNPRYIDKNGQQKNTTTPPPAYKPYQKSNSSNAQPNTTNPRYVAPAAEKKPQPKTDENYNNPRYKPHGKQ